MYDRRALPQMDGVCAVLLCLLVSARIADLAVMVCEWRACESRVRWTYVSVAGPGKSGPLYCFGRPSSVRCQGEMPRVEAAYWAEAEGLDESLCVPLCLDDLRIGTGSHCSGCG